MISSVYIYDIKLCNLDGDMPKHTSAYRWVTLIKVAVVNWRKLSILLAVAVLSVVFYRPFCKWLCPLGAFYALFNKVSLFQMQVDPNKCISCGKCAKACQMDVDITKTPNHTECIRCGMCVRACPTHAVAFRYGFGNGRQNTTETTMED